MALSARPLRDDEDELWLGAGPPPGDERRRQLEGRAEHDPRSFVIALRDGTPIGRLQGVSRSDTLFVVAHVGVKDDLDREDVASALGAFLAHEFGRTGTEVLLWERPQNTELGEALVHAGFALRRRKVFVERDLGKGLPAAEASLSFASLAEVGRDVFVEILAAAAAGDPFEEVVDPEKEFQALVDYAGDRFDPAWWKVAYEGSDPVGVVLPQVYPGAPDEGTLFYVGVLPSHRGRGLGTRLHAAGLAFLYERGARRYMGSTDDRNAAMVRVFAANGCEQIGAQLFFGAAKPGHASRGDPSLP